MKTKISAVSKLLLLLSAVMLSISIFVPIWQIELDAPQYPEGLALQIWANKIGGDVEIINGLNHYIGMKTLHTEDFVEFTILPYIIAAYAFLFLLTALAGRRRLLYIIFGAFVLFGIVAMVDFWIWEYNYGHNLDPNAAIKVPGMAYQPPLIGFKQLLNFGAYSVPHIGGWLFIGAGMLTLIAVLKEAGTLKRFGKRNKIASVAAVSCMLLLISCSSDGPQPIRLHADGCDFCRMTIADGKFGAEIITNKGRVYKFDDISCMIQFKKDLEENSVGALYVHDYTKDNVLIDAATAWYVQEEALRSPMGGNTAAFGIKEDADGFAANGKAVERWNDIVAGKSKKHQNEGEHP